MQSPYYFMCCNLWNANEERAAQTTSQSVLAGTLVSSLHRLKDIDNTGKLVWGLPCKSGVTELTLTDGGFFVFGDLSIKIEGEFRLRFSLFEMKKYDALLLPLGIEPDQFQGQRSSISNRSSHRRSPVGRTRTLTDQRTYLLFLSLCSQELSWNVRINLPFALLW